MRNNSYFPLALAILVLLLSGAVYGGVQYLFGQEQTHITDNERQIENKKSEIARAHQAQAALTTLADDEAVLKGYSLSRQDIVAFLESLQSTGTALGSQVHVLSVSDEIAGMHPRVTLSLLITGSFDAVMRTIGMLENAPYDTVLSNLTLSSNQPPKGPVEWSAATTISVGVQRLATSTNTKKL